MGGGRSSTAPRRVQRPLRAGVSDMVRALLSGISLLVVCVPALAQQGEPAVDMPSLSAPWFAHLAITLIGMMFAAGVFQKELPEVIRDWLEAAKGESPSYLLIIAGIGAIYLYLLTREAQWNVLLMMRNTIQSWISIPELARKIVAQIQLSLHVPPAAIAELVGGATGLSEQDFRKDRNTPDRQWAETCYMKWWLTPRQARTRPSSPTRASASKSF